MKNRVLTGENSDLRPDRSLDFGMPADVHNWICIPAYKENSLLPVLHSLQNCKTGIAFGLILLINAPEDAAQDITGLNNRAFDEMAAHFEHTPPPFPICLRSYSLPAKKAGVGLARKLAMDLACTLMPDTGLGLLLCLDADCSVAPNYLEAVSDHFARYPGIQAASIHFEHRMPEDPSLAKGIRAYELHLRTLKNGLQWAGYPWYQHTVGSSMAVRAGAYLRSGGMNTRQAAEDFWFLHKLMPLGFGEVLNTTVFPEARISDRVPFGTGRSLGDFCESGELLSYDPRIYAELRKLFACMQCSLDPDWAQKVHPELRGFCLSAKMDDAWTESLENSSDAVSAHKRFLKWWSGIRGIHAVHRLRDRLYPNIPVEQAATELLEITGRTPGGDIFARMRLIDREAGISP